MAAIEDGHIIMRTTVYDLIETLQAIQRSVTKVKFKIELKLLQVL